MPTSSTATKKKTTKKTSKRGGRKKGVSPNSAGEWKTVFLKALQIMPVIRIAALQAKVSRAVVYRERKKDPEFATAMDSAREDGIDVIEASLYKRAREKSDTAAIFMLKSHRRQIYGDKLEHLGSGDNDEIQVRLNIPPPPNQLNKGKGPTSIIKDLLTGKKKDDS